MKISRIALFAALGVVALAFPAAAAPVSGESTDVNATRATNEARGGNFKNATREPMKPAAATSRMQRAQPMKPAAATSRRRRRKRRRRCNARLVLMVAKSRARSSICWVVPRCQDQGQEAPCSRRYAGSAVARDRSSRRPPRPRRRHPASCHSVRDVSVLEKAVCRRRLSGAGIPKGAQENHAAARN